MAQDDTQHRTDEPDEQPSAAVVYRKDGTALTEFDLRRLAREAEHQVMRTWPTSGSPR